MKVCYRSIYKLRIPFYIITAANLPRVAPEAVDQVVVSRVVSRGHVLVHRDLKGQVLAADVVPDEDALRLRVLDVNPAAPLATPVVIEGVVHDLDVRHGVVGDAAGGHLEARPAVGVGHIVVHLDVLKEPAHFGGESESVLDPIVRDVSVDLDVMGALVLGVHVKADGGGVVHLVPEYLAVGASVLRADALLRAVMDEVVLDLETVRAPHGKAFVPPGLAGFLDLVVVHGHVAAAPNADARVVGVVDVVLLDDDVARRVRLDAEVVRVDPGVRDPQARDLDVRLARDVEQAGPFGQVDARPVDCHRVAGIGSIMNVISGAS